MTMAALIVTHTFWVRNSGAWVNQSGQGNVITTSEIGAWTGAVLMRHDFVQRSKHKYRAQATVVDGIRFDSKKEGRYYGELKLRQQAGEVLCFLRQVPVHLPGQTRLVIDFLEFHTDGSVHFVDTKGVQTETFKLKRRQVEDLYPFDIEVV